jgi:hypothetical protein
MLNNPRSALRAKLRDTIVAATTQTSNLEPLYTQSKQSLKKLPGKNRRILIAIKLTETDVPFLKKGTEKQ